MKKWLFFGFLIFISGSVYAQTNNSDINLVDLVWEAQTSVPPLYHGKAQPSAGSQVKVSALPLATGQNGVRLKITDFDYQWSKNGEPLPGVGGSGQNILNYLVGANENQTTIAVTATALADRNLVLRQEINIPVLKPKLVYYEKDPLWGTLYHLALPAEYELKKPELTVLVEPFFFNSGQKAMGLEYLWKLNGQRIISDESNPHTVTFTAPANSLSGKNIVETSVKAITNQLIINLKLSSL